MLQTLRSSFKSKGVLAMALCGVIAVLGGSLYLYGRHPAFGALSLTLLTLMAVTAVSQLVKLRWVQETEARKARSRFRELREALRGLSTPAHQASTPARQVPKTAAAPAEKKKPVSPATPSPGRAIGRLAAAVEDDRDRQARILSYLGVPPAAPWGGRIVYAIMGRELDRYLGDTHALEFLRPSTIGAQIASGSGSALVIDDSAFTSGIWFGADSAAGTPLANEILPALAECRSRGIPVYFVKTRRESDIYTLDFEAASDVVFSDRPSLDEWTEDYTFGLLASLEAFAKMKKGALIGTH
ncbi:hypothetical protein [Pseudarthrobacter sp. MM222]|uniref:hypothetical protein n=1 Tax=Pseudarthrobacter sp. MM222 TaxID=3018929 RepID=UPI0022205B1B|nr:hypothetical protein [Pseudarthrobacter sp. MM222]